jgi:group I intron endonuclease
MKRVSAIYKITNKLNMMFYIGRSVNVEKRLKQHRWDLKANRHHNPKLQNSFNKYGEENFEFSIAFIEDPEYLIIAEQILIDEGLLTGRCFNINTDADKGGVIGRVWTPEQIENIKRGQQASERFSKTSFKNMSDDARKRALELARTPEALAKRAATLKSRLFIPSEKQLEFADRRHKEALERTFLAIEWVLETRSTMKEANKKFKINQRMWPKAIKIWEENTGRIFDLQKKACGNKNPRYRGKVVSPFGIFDTIEDAHISTSVPRSTIARLCRNCLKGWSYLEDNEEYLK